LRRQLKGTPPPAAVGITSHSPASSESAMHPRLQEEGAPFEPSAEPRIESEVDRAPFAHESVSRDKELLTPNFIYDVASEAAKKMETPFLLGDDLDEWQETVRRVKANRSLARLVEKEEQQLKTQQEAAVQRSRVGKTYLPVPSISQLRSLKSISQREAADYLRRTPRTIRNYVGRKKLNVTPNKRVVCDDKLVRLLRQTHGDAILP
jgi:hypothetical protein